MRHYFLPSARSCAVRIGSKMAADTNVSPPAPAVVRGYRVRSGGQSCCHSLSIALISSLNAFAILFFVKSAFAFGDEEYVDNTIERCGGTYRDGK